MAEDLPIVALLDEVKESLSQRDELVLEAPPGAGKTTQVPLALLDEAWLAGRKILMLEPRRIAARGAAERMADLLGEPVGERVGYRVRMESRVSAATRIEVVTEGILQRMLQADPSLDDIGLLIFDEFHERSLDADLGLALALEGRSLFSELRDSPLKVLLMSATLNGSVLSDYLNQAPLLRSEGRQYPVDIIYRGLERRRDGRPPDYLAALQACVVEAHRQHSGNILVFLPGQGDIHRLASRLSPQLDGDTQLAPLYGNLSLAEQRRAIAAPPKGQRKIVLATNIAESSLTIDGVNIVVDSGLERQLVFEARNASSRLRSQRISAASAAQRAGRAGRQAAGVCYRLWREDEQQGLQEHSAPEILYSDLSALYLQCLQWGSLPESLRWLDAPPPAHCEQARQLLERCGAVDAEGESRRLSDYGRAMARLPMAPRLAHMVLQAREQGVAEQACLLAALLGERDLAGMAGADIGLRLAEVGRHGKRYSRIAGQARQYLRLLGGEAKAPAKNADAALAVAIGRAFSDRIGRQRNSTSEEYQLSNGRLARLDEGDPLRGSEYLVAIDLSANVGDSRDRIRLACPISADLLADDLAELVSESVVADWDDDQQRFVAQRQRWLGKLLLDSQAQTSLAEGQREEALLALFRRRGLSLLNWNDRARQLCGRVALLSEHGCAPGQWPDFSDEGLMGSLETWLLPYLSGVKNMRDIQSLDLEAMLLARLDWPQQQALQRAAPERISVPSGSVVRVDYSVSPPVLAVKLQEMFGCEEGPVVAEGRQPLLLHLLSPARRPLQVTSDLAGFWRGSYQAVKKDMKGRYPKHPWPDDPVAAQATAYTKARAARQS